MRILQAANLLRLSAVILGLLAFAAGPVAADTIIDFSGSGGFGTVSWDGGSSSPLVGSQIAIQTVSGTNTPANSGTSSSVTSGILSFTTGAFTGMTADGFYNFAAGGSLTITGAVSAAGISDPTTVLLSASNVAAQFNPSFGPSGFQFSMTIPFGSDTKNADLLSYFGLAPSTSFTFSGTLLGSRVTVGLNGFTAPVLSADIMNTATAVPTPSSLLLFGSALIGIGMIATRMRKVRKT